MARSDELCAVAGCGSATGAITPLAFRRFGRAGGRVRLLLGCIVRAGSGDFSGGIGGTDCAFSGF